jgi:hypothetical protein
LKPCPQAVPNSMSASGRNPGPYNVHGIAWSTK